MHTSKVSELISDIFWSLFAKCEKVSKQKAKNEKATGAQAGWPQRALAPPQRSTTCTTTTKPCTKLKILLYLAIWPIQNGVNESIQYSTYRVSEDLDD